LWGTILLFTPTPEKFARASKISFKLLGKRNSKKWKRERGR
jgi:hypothetical protein